jgi:YidC/Oxa1 family membrane protein insertase
VVSFFEFLLSPFVWILETALQFLLNMTGSMGLAIILMSCSVALVLTPLRRYASALEQRISIKNEEVAHDVRNIDASLRGEAKFLETEKIYKKHKYHPIQSVGLSASLFVMLPVFIAAIFVLDAAQLRGFSFLVIRDLGASDSLLFGLNFMPILVTAVTLVDSVIRFGKNSSATKRFWVIAGVLFFLIYNLPSGLLLYWLFSNLIVLTAGFASHRKL